MVPEDGLLDHRFDVRHLELGRCTVAGGRPDQAEALGQAPPISGMATCQASLREEGFDDLASSVMMGELAPSTIERYEWYWGKFSEFCPLQMASVAYVIGFVDHMRRMRNYAYQTTNCLRLPSVSS